MRRTTIHDPRWRNWEIDYKENRRIASDSFLPDVDRIGEEAEKDFLGAKF